MKKWEAEKYVYIEEEIARLQYQRMIKGSKMPGITQILSFTPGSQNGSDKTGNTAADNIDNVADIDNIIDIRKQELKMIETWIGTHKAKDQDILNMRIRQRRDFPTIAAVTNKTEKWIKDRYKSYFEEETEKHT